MALSVNSEIDSILSQIRSDLDRTQLPDLAKWVIDASMRIQEIPAPTFSETRRAETIRAAFEDLGLDAIEVDEVFNVYGLHRGSDPSAPAVMLTAHSDTVFASDTDLATRHKPGIIWGPGIGDNSIGVAAILGFAEACRRKLVSCQSDIWLVATSREEGLGDLGGIKTAFKKLKPRVKAVINIEGMAFGHIYHSGIAVRRLRIEATADGGHSWLHFGRPSALHGLVDLCAMIRSITPPVTPRTTYNIGMIDGGQAINAIATHAEVWLDMRSESAVALSDFENQVRDCIERISSPELRFKIEVVGDRPAGSLEVDHTLVTMAQKALNIVGVKGALESGSTDANVPLAANCPAVTIGVTRGGNAHRLDEFIELDPVELGMEQLLLLVSAVSAVEF